MGKNLLIGAIAVLFLLSGCSDKATVGTQDVDMQAKGIEGAEDKSPRVDEANGALASLIQRLESSAQSVYFDFDQFDVRTNMQSAIEDNAALFNMVEAADLNIKVEGNCDEWGTDEYNYALGLKRAKAVKDALVAGGVNADRIAIVSYGESNPACTEASKQCWNQNRRADFKLFQ